MNHKCPGRAPRSLPRNTHTTDDCSRSAEDETETEEAESSSERGNEDLRGGSSTSLMNVCGMNGEEAGMHKADG